MALEATRLTNEVELLQGARLPRRILFMGHGATRTGAPLVLLALMRWLKEHEDVELRLLLAHGGPLAEEYAQLAETRVVGGRSDQILAAVERHFGGGAERRRGRAIRRVRMTVRRRTAASWGQWAELTWANTLAGAALLLDVHPVGPVVTHLHEMRYVLSVLADAEARAQGMTAGAFVRQVAAATNRFVVPSAVTARDVREVLPVGGRPVHVIPAGLDGRERTSPVGRADSLRMDLGIPYGSPVVVACGTMEWRKGSDLFVQIAAAVNRRGRDDVHFVWVGADEERCRVERLQFETDAANCGVGHIVHLVGSVADPDPYLAMGDLFLLTSREDPFPLVALEAARLGRAVVGFAGVTGAADWLGDGGGVLVPYGDVEAMAAEVSELLAAPVRRAELGETAAHRVAGFEISRMASRFTDVMKLAVGE